MRESLRLPLRLVLVGFATVVIQQSAVSQISIFGVSADLTPLVVMSVGLLTGSLLGAVQALTPDEMSPREALEALYALKQKSQDRA